jgi:hypothetical protein
MAGLITKVPISDDRRPNLTDVRIFAQFLPTGEVDLALRTSCHQVLNGVAR